MPTPRDRAVLEAVRTHGRLTREQVRRLFFRRPGGGLVSAQAVNARLHKLTALGLLDPVVVNGGRGAGPYAYGLGTAGRDLLTRMGATHRRGGPGPVWHLLEVSEFRVRLQTELEKHGGALVEWLGEPALRGLLRGRRGWPVPDALVHWRLPNREGTFLLEWDRGTETLAVLTSKLARYLGYWRAKGHRELLPGLGLRPRLVIVLASEQRKSRLIVWLESRLHRQSSPTVLVGLAAEVGADPLGERWWRSDLLSNGGLAAA